MSGSTVEGTPSGRSSITLFPMQVPKAPEVLADALRERILSGEYPEGAALPPERELVIQTGMSRTTVREALRILEVQGLVRIKTGRAGGAFVQTPREESVAKSVELLIRGRKIRLTSLLDTREALEPFCAKLAAKHRTVEDLEVLDAANRAIDSEDLETFLRANINWHVAVAVASHNELLTGFMMALSEAIHTATANEGFVDSEVRAATLKAHLAVTAAIREQDPEAAGRRMTRHVHFYAEAVLQIEDRAEIPIAGRGENEGTRT